MGNIDQRTRAKVVARTYGKCIYCGWGAHGGVDHLIPTVRGGTHDLDNLFCCCPTCNSAKCARTLEEFRHSAALRILDWPPFTHAMIEWLRDQGFDLSAYDGFQFHFEKSPHKCMQEVRQLVGKA